MPLDINVYNVHGCMHPNIPHYMPLLIHKDGKSHKIGQIGK